MWVFCARHIDDANRFRAWRDCAVHGLNNLFICNFKSEESCVLLYSVKRL